MPTIWLDTHPHTVKIYAQNGVSVGSVGRVSKNRNERAFLKLERKKWQTTITIMVVSNISIWGYPRKISTTIAS